MQPTDFDDLIHVIYRGTVDDDAFQHALKLLADRFRCKSSAFIYTDRLRSKADIQLTHGPFSSPELRARYMAVADDDPAPGAMARLSVGDVAATDRLFSPEARATSRFLNEFYRPLGFEEAMGGPVVNGDGRVGIVAIHRGPDREPFSDEEIAALGSLLQHFARALTLRRTFFQVTEQNRALAETLESSVNGIMIFGSNGLLTRANAKAREILARKDGLSITRSGHLRLNEPEADRRLRAMTPSTTRRQTASILRARRDDGQRPYLVRLKHASVANGGYTIYVSDPDSVPKRATESIEAAFGLSRQSAALVSTLAAGGDLATYAATAGISRNTAKFHLQSAFTATGTARQADLVREVTSALRDLGVMDLA